MNRRAEEEVARTLAAVWTASGASVRGASHVRDGLPNQDALACWTSDDAAHRRAIVSVADGHGSARHFRSALGARFAVDASSAALRAMADVFDSSDAARRAQLAAVELPQRIVEGWNALTRTHLDAHPLTDAELETVGRAEGEAAIGAVVADPMLAYGATVLAALVSDRCIVITQLGDGDILAVDAAGATTRPLPADERLVGNMTTSICRVGAEGDFRSVVLPRSDRQVAVLLSTDGYANSFKSDADFLQVGGDFAAMIAKDGIATVDGQLEAILGDASHVGSGDDITLGILQCVDGSPAARALGERRSVVPAETIAPFVAPATSDPRVVDAERRVGRMQSLAIAAIVVALCALGWDYRDQLPNWFKADHPTIGGEPSSGDGLKPGKGDRKGKLGGIDIPEGTGEKPAKGLSGDGGVLAPTAATIEDPKATRAKEGATVVARVVFGDPADNVACRFEATLWNAKDQKLASGEAPIASVAESSAPDETTTVAKSPAGTPGKTDTPSVPDPSSARRSFVVSALVAWPKDPEKGKAAKSKDVRFSTAVVCGGQTRAETQRRPLDG